VTTTFTADEYFAVVTAWGTARETAVTLAAKLPGAGAWLDSDQIDDLNITITRAARHAALLESVMHKMGDNIER
jgi:hypothetical protein